ncbi:hypothetical protein IFM89_038684 [Coptis chinensis]|uniref:DUF4283 domain-containing protein n=1 Tax=Coptis chinensis TaxID=261450 RepID=A0A835M0W6_9MAGN|nr:hypothetical protein IFM89_038684 [Coptis chinensis]
MWSFSLANVQCCGSLVLFSSSFSCEVSLTGYGRPVLPLTRQQLDRAHRDGVELANGCGWCTRNPLNVIQQGVSDWSDYLVGYFVEKRLPFQYVNATFSRLWKTKAAYEIIADKELFYFKFSEDEDRSKVLEAGPYVIASKIFVLRKWSVDIDIQCQKFTTIPIWAHLDLPKQLWSRKGLGYVASYLGKSLCLDKLTAKKERISFARVEYPWIPSRCKTCSIFGHSESNCPVTMPQAPKTTKKTYKKKNKVAEAQTQTWVRKDHLTSRRVTETGETSNLAVILITQVEVHNEEVRVPHTHIPAEQEHANAVVLSEAHAQDQIIENNVIVAEIVPTTTLVVRGSNVEGAVPRAHQQEHSDEQETFVVENIVTRHRDAEKFVSCSFSGRW